MLDVREKNPKNQLERVRRDVQKVRFWLVQGKCPDFLVVSNAVNFQLDLSKPIESQGTFCVFLHKLTDIIASADQGDPKVRTSIP